MGPTTMKWMKSSYCADATCVEVAVDGDHVAMRDGKNPHGARICMPKADWETFLYRVAAGDFPSRS